MTLAATTLDLRAMLKRPDLVQSGFLIDGRWISQSALDDIVIENPADGTIVGTVVQATRAHVGAAIKSAQGALPIWRRRLASDRGARLRRWAELLITHQDDLALIMTAEQGKPLHEARGEIDYAAGFLRWYASEAERLHGETLQPHKDRRLMLTLREPVGIVAAITPWNFPAAMLARKAGAALAAGCVMIARPDSLTPLSALALGALAIEAGIPGGVLNVLVGDGPMIAGALSDSVDVRAISFTGSTEVGRILLRQSAETVKKVSMELGGHAPFIAFDDIDLERAVEDAIAAKFVTSGQDCLAVNRFYIHRAIYEAFCERFAAAAAALEIGPGWRSGVKQGPLIHRAAVDKCARHVADACERGASLIAGGKEQALGSNYFYPTVLKDCSEDMLIFREETFGPVAAITAFEDEDAVIACANATPYGLAAYLYTNDMKRIWRVSQTLEFGMIGVNTPEFTGPPIPFGGYKQSGLGREGGSYGVDDYLETKYLCLDIAS